MKMFPSLYSPENNVMQDTWGIESGLYWQVSFDNKDGIIVSIEILKDVPQVTYSFFALFAAFICCWARAKKPFCC